MFEQVKTFLILHKTLAILGGMLVLLFIVSLPLLLSNNSGSKQTTSSQQDTTASAPSIPTNEKTFNPLIDNREVNRIQDAYQEQSQKAGQKEPVPVHYKIHLEITPSPQSNKSSFLPVEQSYAAGCSVSGSSVLPGYSLKSHFGLTEAEAIATSYGFSGSVMSEVPMEDGKNFAYYFSDSAASSFLQLAEPSGASNYHIAVSQSSPNSSDKTTDEAQKIADGALTTYKLANNNAKPVGSTDSSGNYVFTYPKKYGSLQLLDLEAIKESKGSLCGLSSPKTMGYEEVRMSKKGEIAKVVNEARTITGTYSLKTESFADAVTEYGDSLPTDPILLSGSLGTSTDIGIKSIGDSTLTYFDYGDNYAQLTYIPVYLAKATTTTGASIIAVVPAVSKAELDKTPLGAVIESKVNLQLQTFVPPPAKSSTAPPGGCYGHLVDYRINCTDNGASVCNTFVSLPSNNDPYQVCSTGCQNKDETINSSAVGAGVCGDMVKKLKDNTVPSGSKSYVCHVNGCPC